MEKMHYTPYRVFKWLNGFVKGQDDSLQKISTALCIHINAVFEGNDDVSRSNILIIGNTGSGKTETVRALKAMNLPCVVISQNSIDFSPNSWHGKSFDEIFTAAYKQARKMVQEDLDANATEEEIRFCALEATRHSIIVIDEFDKIAKNGRSGAGNADAFAADYQHTLLGIIEGNTDVTVEVSAATQFSSALSAHISTKNMQFIMMGAFAGLEEITKKRVVPPAQIGFKANEGNANKVDLTPSVEDLEQFGFSRELLGRIQVFVKYNPLHVPQIVEIMKRAVNSPVNKLRKRMEMLNFSLAVSDTAYEIIANKVLKFGTGVRGVENYMASIVYPTLYAEADGSPKQILIDENAANGYEPPSVSKIPDSDLVSNEMFRRKRKKK